MAELRFGKKQTMKSIVLLLFLPFGVLAQVGGGRVNDRGQKEDNLTIQVNEGIELMTVVHYLGGMAGPSASAYQKDVVRYFAPYRCHEAPSTLFAWRFPVYSDLTECGLAFENFPDIRLRRLPDSCNWFKSIPRDSLEAYLRQCMQFYRDTRFHEFYLAHAGMFRQWAQGLRDSIAEPIRIFDSLINTRRDRHWLICLDPLNGWGAHTVMPRSINMQYQNNYIYQLGYFGKTDSAGRMVFTADLYDFAWHEGTHAFTDSLLLANTRAIDSLAYLMPQKNEDLRRQNINDWNHYFDELLPRAVSIALTRQFRSQKAYEDRLKFEERRGFVHVKVVSDLIYTDFIHERKVKDFEALLPEILKLLAQKFGSKLK